jgi:hypothetical protein
LLNCLVFLSLSDLIKDCNLNHAIANGKLKLKQIKKRTQRYDLDIYIIYTTLTSSIQQKLYFSIIAKLCFSHNFGSNISGGGDVAIYRVQTDALYKVASH